MSDKDKSITGLKCIQADYEMVDPKRTTCFVAIRVMNEQQARIESLENALKVMIDTAEQVDGWESFPQDDIDLAIDALENNK